MMGGVFQNVTGVNPTVARSCSLVALGTALVPAPFAIAVLATSVLVRATAASLQGCGFLQRGGGSRKPAWPAAWTAAAPRAGSCLACRPPPC